MAMKRMKLEDIALKEGKYPLPLELREKRAIEMATEKLSEAGVREITFPSKISSITAALKADGVGTKILIAEAMEKYDTVGIDAVAMTANDLLCLGSRPLMLVDYLAQNRDEPRIHKEIINGVEKGCNLGNIMLVGGETATLGDMIQGYKKGGYHFDLASVCLGIIGSKGSITGDTIKSGDVIVGLKSNGLHSNGFLWARPLLLKEFNKNAPYKVYDKTADGEEIGEVLLKPTLIYVKPVLKMIEELNVKGISHITGGAFKIKLPRIAPPNISFVLNNMPEPPWIFREIQNRSNASLDKLYETFNMGIGMCIVVPKEEGEDVISIANEFNYDAQIIGLAKKDDKTRVYIPTYNIVFERVE
jgi:phosphoribosylformylglycinamidine cyclo-ligase